MVENLNISIVIPAYNEEKNLPVLLESLRKILSKYSQYEILIVNDGSTDHTLEIIKQSAQEDSRIKYISFIRNYGHQTALRAGIEHATGDCVISLDADMQHPPEMIPKMIALWQQGYDIVYTVRTKSKNINFFKKLTSSFFYFIFRLISGTNVPSGAADFRLMSRAVITSLKEYKEVDLFLRGHIFQLGYKMAPLPYVANERLFGKTHYTFKKMFKLALSGLFSYSARPLIAMSHIAFFLFFIGLLLVVCILFSLFLNNDFPILSLVFLFIILFISSIQFLFMGVIGQYTSIIFSEIKKRPPYFISEQNIEGENNENS